MSGSAEPAEIREIDTGTEDLLCRVEDRVAVLTLNRPEARNALTWELKWALLDLIPKLGQDDGVGCLLLTGAGASFCAGAENKTERSENLAQARKTLEAVDQLGIPLVLVPMTRLNIAGLGRSYLEPTASPEQEQLSFRAESIELRARMDSLLALL